ncbi:hypothetical protein sS8_3594 [Methylocaldum marinum]|uniref:Uncharacterized protein n=1 Tax=Methylocaldum marinum TaxID=1432792 RepID=A0A250KX51_9GAMM|nr:hypothetical protein sS8_3594 [Methylocaldum marinum]
MTAGGLLKRFFATVSNVVAVVRTRARGEARGIERRSVSVRPIRADPFTFGGISKAYVGP